jgi:hypothetical protein
LTIEQLVLATIWLSCILILFFVVPRQRVRELVAVFLFFQTLTWLFSIALSYHGLLYAPVREFPDATKISFTLEYIAFPSAAVFFQLWYPEKSGKIRRTVHYGLTVGGILLFMLVVGSITELMTIKVDNLIRSFCNFTLELLICRRYIVWFMKPIAITKEVNSL